MSIGVNLIVCNRTPAHRRATEVAVHSLLASDLMEATVELVAVDNGSADDTATMLEECGFQVERLPANVGIAPARNLASARLLRNPATWAIIEVHNDMVFPREWARPLLDVLDTLPDVGLAGASLITPRGTLGSPKVPVDYGQPVAQIMDGINAAALRARRPGLLRPGLQHPVAKRAAMLRQIGLYDEGFEWGNFEDTDEIYRAATAGWRYVVVGDAVVWHHYWFSRLQLDPDAGRSYRLNYARFLGKYPDARMFLGNYHQQTEALYL